MSAWCNAQGFSAAAQFLKEHSDEERDHMMRLFVYVNDSGAEAQLGAIESPAASYDSIDEMFKKIYKHECFVSGEINKLAKTTFEAGDFSTFNFLQWYVAEQHEEEHLFSDISRIVTDLTVNKLSNYEIDVAIKESVQVRQFATSANV
ncbi:Ferritin-like protein 2 [uncultured Candidatus Thioglobus sp.]|nr:Ferritin-like protein 2 [uncultured Candidatus Thioglobus sp.]